jgi:coenzyme F420-reducing hydrogenase delta subunit
MAELRDRLHDAAASLTARPRIMVFGCDHGVAVGQARGPSIGAQSLACIGQLPPSYIDYVLSRDLADGVLLTGCAEGVCIHRFGIAWTEARLAGQRDPHLRARVPRERLTTLWLGRHQAAELTQAIAGFTERLERLAAPGIERQTPRPATAELRQAGHG